MTKRRFYRMRLSYRPITHDNASPVETTVAVAVPCCQNRSDFNLINGGVQHGAFLRPFVTLNYLEPRKYRPRLTRVGHVIQYQLRFGAR